MATTRCPTWSHSGWFIAIHCLVWWGAQLIARPGLDSYGDMVEVYAWSQHWLLGSDKHPQFLPWIVAVWFKVMPKTVASFYLLSAVNLGVALFGIRALGLAAGMTHRQVTLALALQVLAFPYLTLPAKLNMNAILLAVWPWVTLAFLRMIQTRGKAQILWAALLGVLATVAMMSKYYSAVLLLTLFAASLTRAIREAWRSLAPLVFAAVFFVTLLPHLLWLSAHRESFAYAMEQGAGGLELEYILKFSFSPILYWPIPLLIGLGWLYRGHLLARLASLLRCGSGDGDTVIWFVVLGPLCITVVLGMLGVAELSMPWSIPIGFAYTLLMVRNRTREEKSPADRLVSGFRFIWPGLFGLALVQASIQAMSGKRWYYMPEAGAAQAVFDGWAQMRPDADPIRWAAAGNDAARLAYFANGAAIEALPALPDQLPAYYPLLSEWQRTPGVVLCGTVTASAPAEVALQSACLADAQSWAQQHGLRAQSFVSEISRQGLRFPERISFRQAAIYVFP